MNQNSEAPTIAALAQEQWQARVDLAAAYRLVEMHGWGENIYNHISMRVPGRPDRFLIKRHALLYDEVTASNLIEVGMHEDLDESAGVNRPGFTLHGGILIARPDVNCALHLHSDEGLALSAHAGGLRMCSQSAVRFHRRLGYHDYEGLTEDFSERKRISANLGQGRALVLRNHGLLTVGQTVREAFVLMKELLRACRTQLMLEAAGAAIVDIPEAICASTAEQFEHHDRGRGAADWPAYLRILDRTDPSYKH